MKNKLNWQNKQASLQYLIEIYSLREKLDASYLTIGR